MANLIRSAKSGSDWTQGDLDAYNIYVTPQDTATFFGILVLPEPRVPEEILNVHEADDMMNDENARLIDLLDVAMLPPARESEESAVDDFMVELFRLLGYVGRRRYARTRKDLFLPICGEIRHAKTDVCIVDRLRNHILLLVQEDKRHGEHSSFADTEARLIVEGIAAFVYNNEARRASGLPELQEKIMAGIIMVGTTPTFYKVPVTADLVFNLRHGRFPTQRTEVSVCFAPVARQHRRWSEGMKPLDNRRTILSCYEAFKAIAEIND
ncbi:uncharacterized protein EI90DRAFT_2937936 [Cantharellus anzutake]|uniref:uncharacterized protein n=1 Tax=Cantharellus anzutake TaxID=1750568 RepID=UPI0019065DDA|nr:uncharacterized protein EI90DRAFT_2937936 [Cantharellus anzutake]KAF8321941.1 hypothetical protein EI90DRAFT_2937936 [Cantharellus anzutake]